MAKGSSYGPREAIRTHESRNKRHCRPAAQTIDLVDVSQTTLNFQTGGSSGSGLLLASRMEQYAQQGIPIPQWVHTAAHRTDKRNTDRDRRGEEAWIFKPGRNRQTRTARIVTYNANSLNTTGRLDLVSTALRGCIIGVQGTRLKHGKYDTPYRTRTTPYHTSYDFSCPSGRQLNEPAGVSIILPKNMAPYVREIHHPTETHIQGRAGAIRIRKDSCDLDVTLICVYAHTETPDGTTDKQNIDIWKWVDTQLGNSALRNTPIILTDANGHVGQVPR